MMGYISLIKEFIVNDSIYTYIVVFFIGFISSLNPHMLAMIPIFIGNILSNENSGRKWSGLFIFYISFTVILTSLGIVISRLGASLHPIMGVSYIIAGCIYLYMGLKLLGLDLKSLIPIKIIVFYHSSNRFSLRIFRNIFMPLIFTPCSLPFIISILTLAMIKGSIIYGGLILLSFGLGHGLIFILAGLSTNVLLGLKNNFQHKNLLNKLFGLILILIGIIFILLNNKSHM